jgi:malate dehydrogenase (oxaloacetate-decarboxylating)
MAKNIERPIIFPLSNPTSRCEATPQQIVGWTEGKALIGTGSPFGPAQFKGKEVPFAQTNNSYIFPGLALGILSSHARHVSDAMIKASAPSRSFLPPARTNRGALATAIQHPLRQPGGGPSRGTAGDSGRVGGSR